MKRLRGLILCILVLAPGGARSLVIEPFDYGATAVGLFGLNGGAGWALGWGGFVQGTTYEPALNLAFVQAGYSMDPASTGGIRSGAYWNSRPLIAIQDGVAWVSVLISSFPRPGILARVGINSPNTEAEFGLINNAGSTSPFVSLGATQAIGNVNHGTRVHLLLAKLEINYNASGHDRISLWVNRPNLTQGEAGLGAPDVHLDGVNAFSSWRHFLVGLANNNELDAIRISSGLTETDVMLAEVLDGSESDACENGFDDDLDGLVDLDDPGCDDGFDRSEKGPLGAECDNGLDDDLDGLTDFRDTNGDGLSDSDPGCFSAIGLEEPQCDDRQDNDADGLVDADDPQCVGRPWWFREAPRPVCGAGVELVIVVPVAMAARKRRQRSSRRELA